MAKKMRISFESLHLYAGDPNFQKQLESGASLAAKWHTALTDVYSSATLVNKVFVDDYSETKQMPSREEIIAAVRENYEQAGVALDYIVFESDCAATTNFIRERIIREPQESEGSFSPFENFRYDDLNEHLNFEYVDRRLNPDSRDAKRRGFSAKIREVRNDVGISVRLGRKASGGGTPTTIWSCPTVAAWWQLIRLGVLEDIDAPNENCAPKGSWSRQHRSLPEFACHRTISLLAPSYIGVEHAVRTILSNMLIESYETTLNRLNFGSKGMGTSVLDNISYIFDE